MEALRLVQDLVSFESTSVLSNVPVTDFVDEALKKEGFVTERIHYEDVNGVRKSNVVGKKGDGTGGMAYFAHTDVVPADPWFTDEHGPFTPTIKGDRLYGRGSCDMKGSAACMIAAASRFSAGDLKKPIYVTCTADEEVGYKGAKEVAERSELFKEMVAGEANGIIGEPTMLEVVYAHKGTYGFVVTSRGRAAHSSTGEGKNANLAMIPFLVEMKKIHDETETDAAWHHEEFDPSTVCWNIGVNDFTPAVNITPPQSVCTVYFRPTPGLDADGLLERSRKAAEDCGLEFDLRACNGPLYVERGSDFVQEVLSLTGEKTASTVPYGTDGAVFSTLRKLLVYGPGDIAQAHTHDEWIELDQVERGTEAYTKLIQAWCT